ncbi:hypothetical protein [Aquimarina litoralis]|uniref:hypothetical protein n=1 Tax=Aquimarina litoralis TaxID=584605 RepID=UPI001C586B97|nr:hypothetical protein [Aquimarina litoralis]MBW1298903.1 hypothetical protein [Aquimarina litoralis]
MKVNKQIVASVFLVLFCMIQFAELHVFGHDDAESNCALCLVTVDQVDDDYLILAPQINSSEPFETPSELTQINYTNSGFDSHFMCLLSNKAPPIL